MNSKIVKSGSDSVLEAKWNNSIIVETELLGDCKVNPLGRSLFKDVIINLPLSDDRSIRDASRVISRFPLKTNRKYELVPYGKSEQKMNIESGQYSRRILNQYLLKNKNLDIKPEDCYILGNDVEVDGYLTLVGNLIISTINS